MERAAQVLEAQLDLSVREGSFYEQLKNIKYATQAGLAHSQPHRELLVREDFDVEMEDVQDEGAMDWKADDPSACDKKMSTMSVSASPIQSSGFAPSASTGAFGSSTASSGFASSTNDGAFGSSTTSSGSLFAPLGAQPTASPFSGLPSAEYTYQWCTGSSLDPAPVCSQSAFVSGHPWLGFTPR